MQSQSLKLDVGEEKENTSSQVYLKLTYHVVRDTIDVDGKLQHQFSNLESAQNLVDWLKQQDSLKRLDINKIKPSKMKIEGVNLYVVVLSKAQYHAVIGEKSFNSILCDPRLQKLASVIRESLGSILNSDITYKSISIFINNFNDVISDPDIKNCKLNQKRLMHSMQNDINLLDNVLACDKRISSLFKNVLLISFIDNFHQDILDLAFTAKDSITTNLDRAKKLLAVPALIIEKISIKILRRVLLSTIQVSSHRNRARTPYNITTLCFFAERMNENQFSHLLNVAGTEIIEEALKLPSDSRTSGLHDYIWLTELKFLSLIKSISPEFLGEMLSLNPTNVQIASAFVRVILEQSTSNLIAVMKLVSPEDLGKALIFQGFRQWSGLMGLIYRSNDEALLYAIQKISIADLDKAISIPADDGCTPLHAIPKQRGESVVAKLVELSSPNALNACCSIKWNGSREVIDWFFLYLSSKTIVAFLEKIDSKSLESMLKPSGKPVAQNYVNKIAEGVLNDPVWQHEKLIRDIFKLLGQQIAPICLKYWNMGKPLSSVLTDCVLANMNFIFKDEELAFQNYKPVEWYLSDYEEKPDCSLIKTGKGSLIEIENIDLVERVWHEGFYDWSYFRRLKSLESAIPNLRAVLETLYRSGRVLLGATIDCILPISDLKDEVQIKNILDGTRKESILIKIIKDIHWKDFIKQISNYNYRSKLRKEVNKNDQSVFTHKYVHMTEEILAYLPKRRQKIQSYTKKISATLISKAINTAVFGEHDRDRDLVGVLINMNQCKIKAMLTQDWGTFSRKWIGTQQEVIQYKKDMEGITFSDINKFRNAVRDNPHRLNELLVKITREAILAIVTVTNCPKSRKEALSRQAELSESLNIYVPIVCYDRPLRNISFFLTYQEEIENALIKDPSILLEKAMLSRSEFLSYLSYITDEKLAKVLNYQSSVHHRATALHKAAITQSEEVFLIFLNKFTKEVLNQTAILYDGEGYSVLATVVGKLDENAFIKYINSLDTEVLCKAAEIITHDERTLLDFIFSRQPIKNVIHFLNLIDETAIDFILFYGKNRKINITKISDYLFHHTYDFPEKLIQTLFNNFGLNPILANISEQLWLDGYTLPPVIIKQLKILLDQNIVSGQQREILRLITNNEENESKIIAADIKDYNNIDLKQNWHGILGSWSEYRNMRLVQNSVPGLTELLDHLYRIGRTLEDADQPYQYERMDVELSTINNCILNGAALFKNIPKEDWGNNLKKLVDHNFVPENEKFPEMKSDSFEFNFLLNKIQPYHSEDKDISEDKFSRPTTARLMSSDFNSFLATNEDLKKSHVGLLFNSQFCEIKAMLMLEGELNSGDWVGSEAGISNYAEKIKPYNYQTLEEFSKVVTLNPFAKNEALIRASSPALLAIVIIDDSPVSREIARERQQQVKDALHLKLPVIFYDSVLRKIKFYSLDEMMEDQQFLQTGRMVNIERENKARLQLLAIKSDIANESSLKKFSIFGMSSKKPKTAEAVLGLISQSEQNPNAMWSKSARKVKRMLSEAIANPGRFRLVETQEFYVRELKKYF